MSIEEEIDVVAGKLFRIFDDASAGREPLHDFDVLVDGQSEYLENWRALAREAIRLGLRLEGPAGVVPEDDQVSKTLLKNAVPGCCLRCDRRLDSSYCPDCGTRAAPLPRCPECGHVDHGCVRCSPYDPKSDDEHDCDCLGVVRFVATGTKAKKEEV